MVKKTKLKNAKSSALFTRAKNVLVGGVNSPVRSFSAVGGSPLFVSKAKGAFVYDPDGNRYTDYIASWGPLIIGHAHPSVVRAVTSAARAGTSYGVSCEPEIELAKIVTKSFKSVEKVRMTNSGTEALMSAVRLARAFTRRDLIVKFDGCYHGHADHLLVKAGSGAATFARPGSSGVPKAFAAQTLTAKYNDTDSVEKLFKRHGQKIAAIVIEPVAGNMGVVPPARGFLRFLRKISRERGALLIFDEVITGFRLRGARGAGAQGLYGVTPDITCLGKIIGGGLPVGAYGARKEIMDMVSPLGPVYQAGTLSGNPLAVAAGIATITGVGARGYEKIDRLASVLEQGTTDAARKTGAPVTVNRVGSMLTVFFSPEPVSDYASALRCDTEKFGVFHSALRSKGVLFPPSQFEAAFISTAHTERDIQKTIKAIEYALGRVYSGGGR
ncbi:MAG: glutamate-1-semialdehyde 2,1-aminomutase [Candidatus Mycalebacterium zealandia]|nr:MAG: glutamate-1-semialdehyde 2,1-aminomutase [Candidatus Mycalebacterium zealandia]